MQSLIKAQLKMENLMSIWHIFFTIYESLRCGIPLELRIKRLEENSLFYYIP